jgi:competence protein ComEA
MKRVAAADPAATVWQRSSRRFFSWLLALLCLWAAALVILHFRPEQTVPAYVFRTAGAGNRLPSAAADSPAAVAGTAENAVNVNTAGMDELCTIPGVGPTLAQAIIDERLAHGLFYYPEDLLCVRGIGDKTLIKLLPYMKLE